MKIDRPVWSAGALLCPQQFQQQARWEAWTNDRLAHLSLVHPWGVQAVAFDQEALRLGMESTLLKYEPRLAAIGIEVLPQVQPGHLEYALEVQLKNGKRVSFGTTVAAEGKVLVRHLKRQNWLSQSNL